MFADQYHKYQTTETITAREVRVVRMSGSSITSIEFDGELVYTTNSTDPNIYGDGTDGEEDALRKKALLEATERQERLDSIKTQYEKERKVAAPVNDGIMVSQSERCGRRYPTGFG